MKIVLFVLLLLGVLATMFWVQVTQPMFAVTNQGSSVRTDKNRLREHVEMLSHHFHPRDASHVENLFKVSEYISQQFTAAGVEVEFQDYELDGARYRNVIASLGPRTRERIVVGAHYDTAGVQPGADDNASGVAGLIELARSLAETNLPLRVELAAYTLEEPPFFRGPNMGSARHVKHLLQQDVKVRMMLALEMIGYFSDRTGSQLYPSPIMYLSYPRAGNFIAVVGQFLDGKNVRLIKRAMRGASPLPVYSLNAPSAVPGVDFSDHLNFWQANLPAVMITDTAFYRNNEYHTSADTADRLDYERMAMVVQGVHAAVLALASKNCEDSE